MFKTMILTTNIKNIFFIIIALYICMLKSKAQIINRELEVNTTEGTVIGTIAGDGEYFTFYGIPYAGPTSGNNRFKAPQPPKKHKKMIADKKNVLCIQASKTGSIGIEDCLTLNIFTKEVNSSKPVLVWINGIEYSRIYAPTTFSYKTYMNDLLVIEVNYRLSIFGFLCLGVQEAPGNAGLKDLIQALQWIKKNIASFGGDLDNITLLGHGTGAAMVDILTLTSGSSKLINKVITISGSALSPWAVTYEPLEYAKALAARFGVENKSQEELANFFKTVDKEHLIEEIVKFKFTNQSVLFAPCVENSDLPNSLLTDAPYNILKHERYDKNISYIAIFVTFEIDITSYNKQKPELLKRLQNNFTEFLPVFLKFEDKQTHASVSQSLLSTYFENNTDKINDEDFFEYEGDMSVKLATIESVKERAKTSKSPTRLLLFNCHESNGDADKPGPTYSEIIPYIFDKPLSEVHSSAKVAITKRIIAFANIGLPDSDKYSTMWLAATENQFHYLKATSHNKQEYKEDLLFDLETKITWKDNILPYYHPPQPVAVLPSKSLDTDDNTPTTMMDNENDAQNSISVEMGIFIGITLLLISAGLGFLVHRKFLKPKFLQVRSNEI
ncbi:hypothetical protein ACJJTC_002022 [Scirpophaga incertulas]